MNLKGAEALRYLARPDPGRAGLLIYGADAMRVALKRQEAIASLIGPEGEAEMRLVRMSGGDLRRDGASLTDAVREVGFFPGPRVVLVEEATDSLGDLVAGVLRDWRAGDATVVLTAGALTAKSALRVAVEKAPNAVAIGLYDDPPGRDEIEAALKKAGLQAIAPAAMADLTMLARSLEPGDLRQTLDKIALYKWGDTTPLTPDEVHALAPATIETEVDTLIGAVAEGQMPRIGPLMRRLEGQGVSAVTLCIQATQHFRNLHAMAADPGGPGAAAQRLRVNFKRKDAMTEQARAWGLARLERALAHLIECDLTLRSASKAPTMAVMERCLMRLVGIRNPDAAKART